MPTPEDRPTPATQAALTYLRQVVVHCRRHGVERLPTARTLAKAAGVSHPVLLKALTLLRREGLIDSRRGRGIILTPSSRFTAPPARPQRRRRWRTLMFALENDIHNGVHPAGGMLPSIKELCVQYHAGYRPMKQALEALQVHGSVLPEKRGYRIRELESLHYRNRIVLLARGDHLGNLAVTSPRMHEHLRALERECARHHLRLEVYTYDFRENGLYPAERWLEVSHNERSRAKVLGCIVWSTNMSAVGLRTMVRHLAGFERPISVFDEGGAMIAPSISLPPSSPTRVFTMAGSPSATRSVGRFLLRLGHRKIAYISPFGSALWSRNRLRGLRHAYRVAGFGSAVKSFVSDRDEDGSEAPAPEFVSATLQSIMERLSDEAGHLAAHGPLARALKRLRWRLAATVREEFRNESLAALLRRARNEAPDTTAWVGANDYVAGECLHFLRSEGIRVPEQISVVGLDDALEAHLHKLTSYNFNGEAVMRAMVGHILDPYRTARDPARYDPMEMEGYVVVRESTQSIDSPP
jgi:DNA-binding FadR family transcriptional regulator